MHVTVHVYTDAVDHETVQPGPVVERKLAETSTTPASAPIRAGRFAISLGRALSGVRAMIDLVRRHIGH